MNAEIENCIRNKTLWVHLPRHIKQILSNSFKEYDRHVLIFSIRNQLRYRGNLVRQVLRNEKRYYERVIAYSRERLMLFPYHLADMIVKGLRITPFNYYISVIEKLIQTEKSYDTLPNFTAADCLRLLGIGRNEYIELMNKSRSNKGRIFGNKNVKILLPNMPCDIHIEPWWRVEVGLVLEEDIKMVNAEELEVIDRLIDLGSQAAGEFSCSCVLSLYKKGLIYLDVPITSADRIQVPPLQGFVMNRVTGDYFETLLYKIFVSIDEHIPVGELADSVLQVNTELVKQAVSLYCRLQFARKLNSELDNNKQHISWNNIPTSNNKGTSISLLTLNSQNERNSKINEDLLLPQGEQPGSPRSNNLSRKGRRVAFIFDSSLTAFLMMGNLSPGLKKHAVTMFEVGKLCDESLDSFLSELEKVSVLDAEGEGEALRFFDHAVILRSTVLSLRKLETGGLDLLRLESLHSLDEATCLRLLQKKYKLLISMAPLNKEVRPIISFVPPHLGPAVSEVNSQWLKLFLYHVTGYGPPTLLLVKGTTLKSLPRMFLGYTKLLVTSWFHEPVVIPVANILHVNAALQIYPVLIQAYGVHRSAHTQIIPFPIREDSLNNQNTASSENQLAKHPCIKILENIIDLESNCGYLIFVKIGVLDFGCSNRDLVVRLGLNVEPLNIGKNKIDNSLKPTEVTAISNENFSFFNHVNNLTKDCNSGSKNSQKVPKFDEGHFALIPSLDNSSSLPASSFISEESSSLFQQELDRLELENNALSFGLQTNIASKLLKSPTEENIDMFSRTASEKCLKNSQHDQLGEAWTLLDCHFGVPLFDPNANTKICDAIVYGHLADTKSLEKLVESSRELGQKLLDFISQCQYYPGENMEILKRGTLVPQPRYNLVFDNGKITEWLGK